MCVYLWVSDCVLLIPLSFPFHLPPPPQPLLSLLQLLQISYAIQINLIFLMYTPPPSSSSFLFLWPRVLFLDLPSIRIDYQTPDISIQ